MHSSAVIMTTLCVFVKPGFMQASLSEIQGLFKDFKTILQFQGLNVYEKS